jgi:hypothetical protein
MPVLAQSSAIPLTGFTSILFAISANAATANAVCDIEARAKLIEQGRLA